MTKHLSPPSRSEILANGILVNCPHCERYAYKLRSQGDWHYWCDYCSVMALQLGLNPTPSERELEAAAAIKTLKFLRYTWNGGEQWRPPLGLPPESITGIDYKKLVEEISCIIGDSRFDYVDSLPASIRALIGETISWWRIVPNFPADSWVERYCELTNRNPDGEQTTIIADGVVTSTYRDVAKRELAAALNAAPLAQQPYYWIECSSELPPPNKFVLVSNGVWVGQGLYNDSDHLEIDERWQDEHHEFINLLHSVPVTHWMPLPGLPRKESE